MGELLDDYKTFFGGRPEELMKKISKDLNYQTTYRIEGIILGLYVLQRFDLGDRLGTSNCEEIGNCLDGRVSPLLTYIAIDFIFRLGNKYINGYSTDRDSFNSPGIIGTLREMYKNPSRS